MEKKITASEIIGELRRAKRQYELMERAEEMVSVLLNLEQSEREVQKRIDLAQAALEKIEKQAVDREARAKQELAGAQEEAIRVKQEALQMRDQASEVLRKARTDSANMVSQAKQEVASLKKQLDELKKVIGGEQLLADGLKQAREAMILEMQAKRDQLLKAFS